MKYRPCLWFAINLFLGWVVQYKLKAVGDILFHKKPKFFTALLCKRILQTSSMPIEIAQNVLEVGGFGSLHWWFFSHFCCFYTHERYQNVKMF